MRLRKGVQRKMGLFINTQQHPNILRNDGQMVEHHQPSYKISHLAELLTEQQKMNETLQQSFQELKELFELQAQKQTVQWKYFQYGVREQKKLNTHNEKIENQVLAWLKNLEEKNSALHLTMENEAVFKQELVQFMDAINHSNQEIMTKLEKVGHSSEQLDVKVNEQLDLQSQLSQQLAMQDDTQHEVLNRLENQEALTEKILRQIDHFRSILFERTNHLAEKIDTGYNYTASYLTKLFTGSDQSMAHFMINQKQKENEIEKSTH